MIHEATEVLLLPLPMLRLFNLSLHGKMAAQASLLMALKLNRVILNLRLRVEVGLVKAFLVEAAILAAAVDEEEQKMGKSLSAFITHRLRSIASVLSLHILRL